MAGTGPRADVRPRGELSAGPSHGFKVSPGRDGIGDGEARPEPVRSFSPYDGPVLVAWSAIKGEAVVDVRIGVVQSPREIEVELPDGTDAKKLTAQVEEAVGAEAGVLWLTDRRGRRIGVPASRIAYVELNPSGEERRVGFGAAVR
ncbi:MAG TPA: DUF3107 domain-containing protein [Acidimicrobiales bacterium]|nr:DUF3107 domain-containing protein [Acidimicrobiales bacterium]